jgi:hypothetical protein
MLTAGIDLFGKRTALIIPVVADLLVRHVALDVDPER